MDGLKLIKLFWPPIKTRKTARAMRIPALVFGCFSTVLWLGTVIGSLFSKSIYGKWAMIDAILFAFISWGLYKMRKEAAVASLIVSIVGLILDRGVSKASSDLLLLILGIYAAKATFAYPSLSE